MSIQEKFTKMGKEWVDGKIEIEEYNLADKKIALNKSQKEFINSKKRYCLTYGGFGSGKSLSLEIKLILLSLFFPKNTILLGRKHVSDIEKTVLPDLKDLMYESWYKHHVKANTIEFFNGSNIHLFSLDALQSSAQSDIKKAEQKLKSLNLGAYFIDQLEEIEKKVFDTLNSRLRKKVPIRQGNMTCNPANFWAYEYFIKETEKNPKLKEKRHSVRSSMLDNKENLPEDYLEDQLDRNENYVKRYVKGIWDPQLMTEAAVFPSVKLKKKKYKKEEGCKIYREPEKNVKHQIGVDPSEGSVDPCSIQVISEEGEQCAVFNSKIPVHAIGDKVKFLYYKYNKPRIIPEVNAAGQALLLKIRDLDVYQRKAYDRKYDRETKKLGWKTSYQSKQNLIDNFKELLKEKFPVIHDKTTYEEFKTFAWDDAAKSKGASAQRGYHDDNVMAFLLAFWEMTPKKIAKKKYKQKVEKRKAIKNRYKFQYE